MNYYDVFLKEKGNDFSGVYLFLDEKELNKMISIAKAQVGLELTFNLYEEKESK